MFCSDAPLVSKQNKPRLLLVQIQPRVQFILVKAYQLIFHSVELPLKIKNIAKTMKASIEKPIES